MEISSFDKFIIFIIIFLPGFVSIKVYDLLIPNEPRDFSKSLFEVIAYSAINFAALSWLIIPIFIYHYYNPLLLSLVSVIVLLVCPAIFPLLFIKIIKSKWISAYLIDPIRRPWDWFFNQKQPMWVIITLMDGRKIAGVFFDKSYASSYPLPEQIYLEETWELDEDGRFKQATKASKGIIIIGRDISTIEFFSE